MALLCGPYLRCENPCPLTASPTGDSFVVELDGMAGAAEAGEAEAAAVAKESTRAKAMAKAKAKQAAKAKAMANAKAPKETATVGEKVAANNPYRRLVAVSFGALAFAMAFASKRSVCSGRSITHRLYPVLHRN